jgi:hypothetical protein
MPALRVNSGTATNVANRGKESAENLRLKWRQMIGRRSGRERFKPARAVQHHSRLD